MENKAPKWKLFKKYFLLTLICLILGTGLGFFYTEVIGNKPGNQPIPTVTALSPGIPQRLVIPTLSINAGIEEVGLDPGRKVESPKDVNNVGWYNLGVRPGEAGNSVIDGHLDSQIGPAVFISLSKLQVNDVIIVIDNKNQQFNFRVVNQQIYDFDKVPLNEVFGTSNERNLNLITCTGTFDTVTKNYSQRLVVYTTLKE